MRPRDALATLRLEDGRRWIDAATDWQREDALAVLEGAEPYHFLTRSRGSSKTTDLAGCALSDLVAADRPLRCYWLAADADQGALAVDAIAGFVQRTEGLMGRVDVQARRVVVPETGARLEILPADAAGAWGLNPHRVYADEVAQWNDVPSARRLWEATSSAVAKRRDSRLAVLTTAGSPDHFSFKVLQAARESALWRVSERAGAPPWMSEERLEEQRARLPYSIFQQLFENQWTLSEGAFLDPEAVDLAMVLDGPSGPRHDRYRYFAALDLGSVHDRTAFAVGHREGTTVCLDGMATWQGSKRAPIVYGDVERAVVAAHELYGMPVLYDRWQSLDLTQRLRSQGVTCREYTFTRPSKQRLAQTLLSLLNGGNLKLYSHEGLREELVGLRLVQASDGTWAFDHRPGGRDDMAVVVSMVAVACLERSALASGRRRRGIEVSAVPTTSGVREMQF